MRDKKLLPLAIGGFGIGMTEFVMMGILPDIASDLRVSIPQAGYLISTYALGVVIGAPLLVGFSGKYSPKKVLIFFSTLFTVFNGLAALAPNYQMLTLARFAAGLPHGAFFGVGAVVASRLAAPGRSALAVATMFAGLSVANIVGVPCGTYLGHHFSWRLTFLAVASIGIVTIIALRRWVPEMAGDRESSLFQDLKIFKKFDLWLAIAITSIGTGGFFAWFSYIAPLLTEVSGFSANAIPLIMTVAGVGMTIGNYFGGRLADKFRPIKAIIILMASMATLLALNALFAGSPAVIVVLTLLTGANAMALGAPVQMMLITTSKESEMLGSSLGQTSFNVGNSLGAFLGGIPLTLGYGYASPQWVGVALAIGGGCIAVFLLMRIRIRESWLSSGCTVGS